MVFDRRTVERRLAELDEVLAELRALGEGAQGLEPDDLNEDLSRRWSVERGLLAAANLVFDVANHVLAGHFSTHPSSYEESLAHLASRDVVDDRTYERLRGLGGFRNVLAHEYLDIDLDEVLRWRDRLLRTLPGWIAEVEAWMDRVDGENAG